MKYVIAYDVEDDTVRTRLAAVLADFGWRVQKSVFECDVAADEFAVLGERVLRELAADPRGQVRIYRLCVACRAESLVFGCAEREPGPGTGPSIVV